MSSKEVDVSLALCFNAHQVILDQGRVMKARKIEEGWGRPAVGLCERVLAALSAFFS